MAFQSAANTVSATTASDNWKAQGFINLYLPSKDGKRRKLGSIPLKINKANEKQLLEWLQGDADRIGVLRDKLIVEFQSAQISEEHSFDLG